jgi:hypothetical protein
MSDSPESTQDFHDPEWVRSVLTRHLDAAWADVQDYAARCHPGIPTVTFTHTSGKWTIIHTPIYEGLQVVGYDVEVSQNVHGGYSQGHISVAGEVLKKATYWIASTRDSIVTGTRKLDTPFLPIWRT